MNLKPIDLRKVTAKAANVYEAVIVAGKRARQINDENRLEYNTLVNTLVGVTEDELDERINPDMIKISMEFENRPKPHVRAMNELIDGEIEYVFKEQ